ncbi:MAG: CHASE domain-containing protein [Rickettsiales bacterium]
MQGWVVFFVKSLLIATTYAGLGRLALMLGIPPGFAAPIWPSAAVALVAVLWGGYRYLPAVLIGAIGANLIVSSSLGGDISTLRSITPTLFISIGATLQAAFSAFVVKKYASSSFAFTTLNSVASFIFWAGMVGCLVNGFLGPMTLHLFNILPAELLASSIFTWWVGDAIGVVLFSPALLLLLNNESSKIRKAIVSLPVLLFATIAIFTFFDAKENQLYKKQKDFDALGKEIATELEKDIQIYLNILEANASFINASESATKKEFIAFTKRFTDRYPHILSLSWNPKVTQENRKAYEEKIKGQGFPDFTIKDRFGIGNISPSPVRDVYFPVTYLHPFKGNEAAHGFDTYSEDKIANVRKKVLDRARDEGRTIATGRISVVQAEGEYGLLFYHPVYSNDLKGDSIALRRKHLIGYTAGVFIMPKMLEGLAKLADEAKVDFILNDLSVPKDIQLLYDSRTIDYQESKEPIIIPDGTLVSDVHFEVAGHNWQIKFIQKPGAVTTNQGWDLWYLLIGSLLFSAVFGTVLIVVSAKTEAIQKDVEDNSIHKTLLIPITASGLVLLITVIIWQQFKIQERTLIQVAVEDESEIIGTNITTQMDSAIIALQRMAQRWETAAGTPEERWRIDAKNYVEDFTALTTVEWVDETYHVRWVEPLEENEEVVGLNIAFNEERKRALVGAANEQRITLTPPLDLVQGYRAVISYVPIHIQGQFDGFIVGIYDMGTFLKGVLSEEEAKLYNILIKDGERTIFQNAEASAFDTPFVAERKLELFNRTWLISISPKQALLVSKQLFQKETLLYGGILLSLLAGFAVYTAIISNQRSKLLSIRSEALMESEAKAREAKVFLDLINANNPDLIFVKDAEYRIVQANPAFMDAYPKDKWHKIIGYTTVEDYPKEQADTFLEKDREAFEKGYSETLEKINLPSGEPRIFSTKKIRFENTEGTPFILCIARDVTERENLIERITLSNTELERFAYIASHDMQEPIRMVTSFSEIIATDYSEVLDDTGKEYLNLIVSSGQRMKDLVEDLLAYSRVGNESIKMVSFDGNSTLNGVLENLKGLLQEQNVDITYDTLPQLHGNPIQIMRLLQNLIVNGIKYQPEGNRPKIHIGFEDQEDYWCISVQDNGQGIKEEFIEQIFEPFRRLHAWDAIQGTGLGLSICRKIIENHGGKIWVTSAYGKGSVFRFTMSKTLHVKSEDA